MSNYKYASLGNSCTSTLNVITDNTKYISPDASVYNTWTTNSLKYPGPDYIPTEKANNEIIKQVPARAPVKPSSCCGKMN